MIHWYLNSCVSDAGERWISVLKMPAPSKSQEFTIHVPSSYDYRFSSARRDEIIDVLKKLHLIEQK
jgi:citrate lyase gamma subunit